MPKTLIANRVNGSTKTFAVPATPAQALTFCEANLEGEYAIYKSVAKLGSDVVTVAPLLLSVAFKNDTTEDKGSANFVLPATKTENDLFTALIGTTLNGVLIDSVSTISQRICDKF
jgi:hypothetical protein